MRLETTSLPPKPASVWTAAIAVLLSAGGGYHEYFMGDEGALKMSENPKFTKIYREARAPHAAPMAIPGLTAEGGEARHT